MKAVQLPIVTQLVLDGLTVGPANPLGFQISLTQHAEFLSIGVGLCVLGQIAGTPPTPPQVLNTGLGLRIYTESVIPENSGLWQQGGKPQGKPVHTQIMDGPRLIPWDKSLKLYLEVFSIFATAFPVGSSLELSITPFTGG